MSATVRREWGSLTSLYGRRAASGGQQGVLFFLLASLTAASGLGLSASLHFPEVLLDDRSFATSFVASSMVPVVLSLIGLLACGVLLVVLSTALAPLLPEGRRRPGALIGGAAGLCWGMSAVLGLILVPLWANDVATGVSVLSGIVFVSAALVAPLLLAAWTVLLVWQFREARVIGVLGALGLVVTSARSSVWAVNTFQPADEGFYLTSAILTLVALVGYPAWVFWLIRMGSVSRNPSQARRPSRPVVLAVGKRLGVALLGAVFVLTHASLTTISTPTPNSDAVPAVPSAAGAAIYTVMLAISEQISPPSTYPELLTRRDRRRFRLEVPRGAALETIDAGGVPADHICAEGASDDHAVLFLHGGGFNEPTSNGERAIAATISRDTGACVLLPHYRLAPEDPFPAAVQDSVSAYRWLRQQGIAASRIAISGYSAGANLTFTTALSLRDSGDALPAALVSMSPVTDLTLSGHTHHTKADREAMLLRGGVEFAVHGYSDGGAADLKDPLISPLFADTEGLPPTLLMAGSQEVLLSDSIRMADRLRSARVPITLEVWPGMPHGWLSEQYMESRLALQHISTFISRRIS